MNFIIIIKDTMNFIIKDTMNFIIKDTMNFIIIIKDTKIMNFYN
jgi:hypothetical protein